MGIYEDKFCIQDNLLDGFTYDDLITAVNCNEKEIDKKVIIKVAQEMLKEQITNAAEILNARIPEILKRIKKLRD